MSEAECRLLERSQKRKRETKFLLKVWEEGRGEPGEIGGPDKGRESQMAVEEGGDNEKKSKGCPKEWDNLNKLQSSIHIFG